MRICPSVLLCSFFRLRICLSVFLPISLFLCPPYGCLSASLLFCLFCLSDFCQLVLISVSLSVCPSSCLSAPPPVCLKSLSAHFSLFSHFFCLFFILLCRYSVSSVFFKSLLFCLLSCLKFRVNKFNSVLKYRLNSVLNYQVKRLNFALKCQIKKKDLIQC